MNFFEMSHVQHLLVGSTGAVLFLVGLLIGALHLFAGDLTLRTGIFSAPSKRMSLIDLRSLARSKGWPLDGNSLSGRNEGYAFIKHLQQAAVDGDLKFFGRPYRYEGLPYDAEPIVPVSPDHFRDHLVEIASFLTAPSNERTQTTRLGKMRQELRGEIYDDLHVDRTTARHWLAKNQRR